MRAQRCLPSALLCVVFSAPFTHADCAAAQTSPDPSGVRITVIGCVQRSQRLTAETAATTVTPAGETKYVLSNITLVPEDTRSDTASAGAITHLVAETVNMYLLDDAADSLI